MTAPAPCTVRDLLGRYEGVLIDVYGVLLDVLAVCDDEGYDFLPGIEHALSGVVRAIEDGRRPALILPNPDLVYPKSEGELGITAGGIALLIETILARRYPDEKLAFV